MATPRLPAANIITDQYPYPFNALEQFIRSLIVALFGAGASTVVWRPGAVSSRNVFATWAEVVAQVATMNGAITIGVDVTNAPAVIPVGAWDLRPAGVSGSVELVNATPGSTAPFVTIDNAAVTIHGLSGLLDIQLENRSTSNVITVGAASGNALSFYLRGFASLYQSILTGAGVSFFNSTGGIAPFDLCIYMADFSYIGSLDGGVNAVRVAGGGSLRQLSIEDSSIFDANMLVSAAGLVNVLVSASTVAFVGIPPYNAQALAPTIVPYAYVQRGSSAIVVGTGKTAAIPVFLTTSGRIEVSLKTPVGDANTVKYAALLADRVAGNPGSFQISALSAAGGGAVNGADTSTIDWEVYSA